MSPAGHPVLEAEGVQIKIAAQQFDESGYSVTIDGLRFAMYNENEENDEGIWEIVTQRFLMMLSALLRAADSSERAYLLYGGHDSQIIFLTPAMFELISETTLILDSDKPTDERNISPIL